LAAGGKRAAFSPAAGLALTPTHIDNLLDRNNPFITNGMEGLHRFGPRPPRVYQALSAVAANYAQWGRQSPLGRLLMSLINVGGCVGVAAPPLVPDVIDHQHLARMTLGDRGLEREVLQLFVRQTSIMLARIAGGGPALVAAAAHTLNGSARGIGAWRVAQAAERLEIAATNEMDISGPTDELAAASAEARTAIAGMLGDH
jgi:HPt (histidine-containing phosphotransfer) domain-containing protein